MALLESNTAGKTTVPILGFEGFYLATSDGEIVSLRRGSILVPCAGTSGYDAVILCGEGGHRRQASVHTFIAESFHGARPSPKHEVNHKNGIKKDNRPDNIEWVDRRHNLLHAADHGLKPRGEDSHLCTRLCEADVKEILRMGESKSQSFIAKLFSVSQTHISKILRGQKWRHLQQT